MILSSNSLENIRAILKQDGVARPGLEIQGSIGMFSKARAIRRVVSRHGLAPGEFEAVVKSLPL